MKKSRQITLELWGNMRVQQLMGAVSAMPALKTNAGEFLATKRRAASLSQSELSKRLAAMGHDYAPTTISGWENGGNPPIDDPAFVSALAVTLGVSEVEIYQAAGIFSPSSDVAVQQLVKLLQATTPSELEQVEQFAKFLIANRQGRREQK